MSVLVLRHEPFEHLGHFSRRLDESGICFSYIDLGQPLSIDGRTGVIIMGGPQSANDPDPGLGAEIRLIREAMARGVPILGVCLGAQLIAKALGARVFRNPAKEIGWAPVYFTEAAKDDPLFGGFASPTTFFHWHGETFDLPAGAEWLAYSDLCRHQAFRYGINVYGVQFHPEVTPEMIVDWSAQPVNCGDVDALPAPLDPHFVDSKKLARTVLDGWLSVAGIRATAR
ncbi:MAG TPA: type 1 glutamine amidotransferase [Bryobacteraceae bacterium]|nr:type 1 glutamine amidotransferase [Bryobacteraceae bacterium]